MEFLGSMVDVLRLDLIAKLIVAVLAGAAIGLERERAGKPAGLRTNILICLGSALLMDLSMHVGILVGGPRIGDPGHIAAQIVTGIGFLGAGAIIRQGLSVRGLTTAATLWLVAAIGMATGAGYWEGAIVTTVGAIVILGPLRRIISRFRRDLNRLLVQVPAGGSPVPIIEAIERQGGDVVALDVSQEGDRRSIAVDIEARTESAPSLVAAVAEIDGVLGVQWTE